MSNRRDHRMPRANDRPTGQSLPPLAPSPPTLSSAEIARLRSEYDAVACQDRQEEGAPPTEAAPPPAPRPIGTGNCPKCARYGEIYVEGQGYARKMVYSGCVCPRA